MTENNIYVIFSSSVFSLFIEQVIFRYLLSFRNNFSDQGYNRTKQIKISAAFLVEKEIH